MHAATIQSLPSQAAGQDPELARVQGWVDPAGLRPAAAARVAPLPGGLTGVAAPGLQLTLGAGVDLHAGESVVVVLQGSPRIDGQPISARDLAGRLHGSGAQSLPLGGRYSAIVIDRERRSILLQTDRFGVWPLCFGRNAGRIAFADRADAVAASIDAGLDPQALYDYVYFHMIPAPRTVFLGVSRVEPASAVHLTIDATEKRPAWTPEFGGHRRGSPGELRNQFRAAIVGAVEDEAGDDAVGCFLSGGTDSSTVAGTLKQVTGRAATFSIGFDASGYDEMEYARIAARHFGTDHHEHYVTPAELVDAIPDVARHYDQPFGNSSAVPAFICARLARDCGMGKLLAGDGGDELFGGNTRYARQKVFETWWRLPAPVRALITPVAANALTRRLPLARKAASYVEQASVPMPARMETYNLLKRFGREQLFVPAFLSLVDAEAPDALQAAVYTRHSEAPFVDRMLAYDWRFTLADNDLPKVSGTTRLAGIEVGYPLLADALVDVSLQLAPADKVRGLRLRHFFKESLADFLPPQIIAKQKHGFGLPVGVWLVRDRAFRELAHGALSDLAGRGLIQAALVDDLFSRRLEEHAGYYGEMVWVLMMLEQWLAGHAPDWKVS